MEPKSTFGSSMRIPMVLFSTGRLRYNGDALLMLFIIEIRAVATDNDQQGNLVMHRGPKRADGEQQAAVGLDINAEFAGVLQGQRGTEGSRQTIPQTAAFVFPEDLVELNSWQIMILLTLGAAIGQHPILALSASVISA